MYIILSPFTPTQWFSKVSVIVGLFFLTVPKKNLAGMSIGIFDIEDSTSRTFDTQNHAIEL